jgi:hypothetical protein
MTYAQARKDFETLEAIAELEDQVELDSDRTELMRNPTKKQAMQMYEAGIRLWFHEHGINTETARRIAERHGII